MKIVSGTGFDHNEAFAKKANYDVTMNATRAWEAAGSPVGEELKVFAASYIKSKVNDASGVGFYVKVSSPVKDTREKPYTVENIVNEGTRKFKTYYIPVDENGTPYVNSQDLKETKAEAIEQTKALVAEVKKDLSIMVVKYVVEGEPIAAVVKYTPSINTKEGSYYFFGYERN